MNSKPLPFYFRGLRAGLVGLRILAIIGVLLYPTLLLMLSFGIPGTPAVGLGSIRLDQNAVAFAATRDGQAAPVRLTSLSGSLDLPQDIPASDPLYKVALQSSMASKFGRALLYLAIFHILLTICRNIERGELFTEQNFCLMRKLGVAMIIFSVGVAVLDAWGAWRIDNYVAENLVLEGLKLAHTGAGPGVTGFLAAAADANLPGTFFFAFVVLILSEIFRQAVIIKQENDLTI